MVLFLFICLLALLLCILHESGKREVPTDLISSLCCWTTQTTSTDLQTIAPSMGSGELRVGPNRLFQLESVNVEDFKKICSQTTDPASYPLAVAVQKNIPIYDAATFDPLNADTTAALQAEWHHVLESGPGIFVLKGMYHPSRYADTLNATNTAFQHIIDRERQSLGPKGDHFAASGKNDRIWNSFSKHAFVDPSSFITYYSNPWLRAVSEAWLGPAYRVTAQVNIVKPGGAAQDSHRDYHLGFQELDRCAAFPRSVQLASQYLTLQGAVAHSEMPVESGPTRFLPFSQTYAPGYLTWRRDDFRAFFQANYVALPLEFGDGLFFNPAVFHAAGANEMAESTGFHRKANLLQIGCALGKTMEHIDAVPVVEKCWEEVSEMYRRQGGLSAELEAWVYAVADGYPFPSNLDRRPPAPSGMAPESEQEMIVRGLQEAWDRTRIVEELRGLQREGRGHQEV